MVEEMAATDNETKEQIEAALQAREWDYAASLIEAEASNGRSLSPDTLLVVAAFLREEKRHEPKLAGTRAHTKLHNAVKAILVQRQLDETPYGERTKKKKQLAEEYGMSERNLELWLSSLNKLEDP
jgi:hypothetical protein